MSTPPQPFHHRLRAFAMIGVELALILLFVYFFEIEKRTYVFPMLCVAVGGFAVHAWLPRRFQAWFFVFLSLGGALFLLGVVEGMKLIGLGLGLIAVCHLPLPILLRAVVLLIVAGVLAGLRIDYPKVPFWPVLASMFMFRLIVYLFELRHAKGRTPWALTLSYFFPLPNVCFVMFPVLDFETFRATYFDADDYRIYQDGITWIVRGLSHLLAYRFIKYYLLPAPYQLHDMAHIVLYLAATYALYLRLSGWFHLVTGLLHLFGFNVPRTHQNYFLASSVSDIWRRINIYWKDFMTKVFFFPAFFALRRYGTRFAMFGATLLVFVVTWLLHSYQMFWLAGDLPLSLGVARLWLGAGVLVALTMRFDLARAKGQGAGVGSQGASSFAFWPAVMRSLQTVGTFALVSLFWARWSAPGILESLGTAVGAMDNLAHEFAQLVGIIVAVVTAGVVAQWVYDRWLRAGWPVPADSFVHSAAVHAGALLLLLVVGTPQVAGVFGASIKEMAVTLRQDNPTFQEAGQAMRGYYEEIAVTQIQAGPFLRKLTMGDLAPPDVGHYGDAIRATDDPLLGQELIPGWHGKLGFATTTINRLGMRDREDITVQKPANTYRIAFVGSSIVMGYGVEDGQVFKCLLEQKLNAAAPAGAPRFELLNFAMGRSSSLQRIRRIEKNVLAFEPDAIYYFAHQDELYLPRQFMAGIVGQRLPLPYPFMAEIVHKAGVTANSTPAEMEQAFLPLGREVTRGIYRIIVEHCRQRGIVPVWVYLPIPGIQQTPADAADVVKLAEEAGFVVVNLADWAKEHGADDMKVDLYHPSVLGHRIIAERLFAEMKKRPELLPAAPRLRP